MSTGLVFAFIAPLVWALMNVIDKIVLSRRVRDPLAYMVVAGLVNILYGGALALTADWHGVRAQDLSSASATGVCLGLQFYCYFTVLQAEDASHFIGTLFVFPVLVALASFAFLGERISAVGCLGMALAIAGVMLLSARMRRKGAHAWWKIAIMILLCAGYEFLTKLATVALPQRQGIAVTSIALGLTTLPILLHRRTRAAFPAELPNLPWALLSESLTLLAVVSVYLAMARSKAGLVSAVGAVQPLAVVLLERFAQSRYRAIASDQALLPKLGAILLVALGVALLCASELGRTALSDGPSAQGW